MAQIKSKINADIKSALKNGDKTLVATLRYISAAIKQKEVDTRSELNDDECHATLTKLAKQRREAIECYEKAQRADLRDKEQYELDIIKSYLPPELDDSEVDAMIERAVSEQQAGDIKDMGKVMAVLKESLQGRADMAHISAKVRARLSQ